jgi:hypothetical protein
LQRKKQNWRCCLGRCGEGAFIRMRPYSCCDPPFQSLNLMSSRWVMKLSDRAVPVSAGRNDCRKWTEPANSA